LHHTSQYIPWKFKVIGGIFNDCYDVTHHRKEVMAYSYVYPWAEKASIQASFTEKPLNIWPV